jgi:predicted small metal-binding protein
MRRKEVGPMAEQKSFKCPTCGTVLTAENEDALIEKMRQHTKAQHQKEMPAEEARKALRSAGMEKSRTQKAKAY